MELARAQLCDPGNSCVLESFTRVAKSESVLTCTRQFDGSGTSKDKTACVAVVPTTWVFCTAPRQIGIAMTTANAARGRPGSRRTIDRIQICWVADNPIIFA